MFLLFLLAACGGTTPMGALCETSDECVGDGTCLSGVCAAYSCSVDADCANGLVCGTVAGVAACVQVCTDDDDCLGDQRCLAPADPAETDTAADTAAEERGGESVCL